VHPSHDGPFLRACRREAVPYTPIWLMRQAGRYMKEYRDLRERVSMLELCKTPALVSEVTVHAARTLGVDAAILFSDLLLVAEPLGLTLEYLEHEGPRLSPPVRGRAAIDALREIQPGDLSYVEDGAHATRRDLDPRLPLIGFAGAPFTVASYLIEGGSSRSFRRTKELYGRDEGAWRALLEKIVRAQVVSLNGQIAAGCQAVQIFDSWIGALSPADYRRYAQPYTAALVRAVTPGVPVIHFGTDTAGFLEDFREAGGDVIGVDWRVDLGQAWRALGDGVSIMGNLDPLALFATPAVLEREAARVLREAGGRPGHVFNLGHGILPETPVDHVRRLVDFVHETSARSALGTRPSP
jgi:uroporphyrinogen decarboxylase